MSAFMNGIQAQRRFDPQEHGSYPLVDDGIISTI